MASSCLKRTLSVPLFRIGILPVNGQNGLVKPWQTSLFRRIGLLSLFVWSSSGTSVIAGMPSFVLSDVARARVEVISFFLLCYFLLAWAVKGLWNSLTKTFPNLPRLGYRNALSLMLVAGLLMYVVLTMISGARELMTPGAWEKQGATYKLRSSGSSETTDDRRRALHQLKEKLWAYMREHEGKLPDTLFDPYFSRTDWWHPDGGYYCYLRPDAESAGREVLVYEPGTAGKQRLVLLRDGTIESWEESRLQEYLTKH